MLVGFAEVSTIMLGSIPNGADPMVEWCFLCSSRARLADLLYRQPSAPITVKRRELPKFDLPSDLSNVEGGQTRLYFYFY